MPPFGLMSTLQDLLSLDRLCTVSTISSSLYSGVESSTAECASRRLPQPATVLLASVLGGVPDVTWNSERSDRVEFSDRFNLTCLPPRPRWKLVFFFNPRSLEPVPSLFPLSAPFEFRTSSRKTPRFSFLRTDLLLLEELDAKTSFVGFSSVLRDFGEAALIRFVALNNGNDFELRSLLFAASRDCAGAL